MKLKVLSTSGLAVALLGLATVANAEISSTIALTNDYDFRGVSQSARDPALQASVDYIDNKSGLYAGVWGSNVDFGDDTDLQLNLYTGFTGKTEVGLGWNAGFVFRTYDEHRHDYPEIFTGFDYSYFKARLSYANDYLGRYIPGHTSAFNLAVDAAVPVPVPDLSLLAHVGHTAANNGFDDYTDYFVGVGYKVQKFDLALKYVDTDANPHTRSDVFNNEGRLVFSVATKLPW
jgi:uncharacterized protein (TIGR02001 family)